MHQNKKMNKLKSKLILVEIIKTCKKQMSSTSTSRCKLHNIIKLLKGKTTKGIGKLKMMKMMRMMVMSRFLLWKRI